MGQLRVWVAQLLDGGSQAFHHVGKSIIVGWPISDGFAIGWQGFETGERRAFPIGWAEDDGDDTGLLGLVPGDGLLHFDAVAEVGGHEVGADEQEDELGFVEVGENLVFPFSAGSNVAIVPIVDESLSSQVG